MVQAYYRPPSPKRAECDHSGRFDARVGTYGPQYHNCNASTATARALPFVLFMLADTGHQTFLRIHCLIRPQVLLILRAVPEQLHFVQVQLPDRLSLLRNLAQLFIHEPNKFCFQQFFKTFCTGHGDFVQTAAEAIEAGSVKSREGCMVIDVELSHFSEQNNEAGRTNI